MGAHGVSDFIHRTAASNHPQSGSVALSGNVSSQSSDRLQRRRSLATARRVVKAVLTNAQDCRGWYSVPEPDQLASMLAAGPRVLADAARKHWPPYHAGISRLGSLVVCESYYDVVPMYSELSGGAESGATTSHGGAVTECPGPAYLVLAADSGARLVFWNEGKRITWNLTR